MSELICRNCANTGVDMFGNVCVCQRRQHGASCICPPCMEQSDRAFTVWYDAGDVDPAASLVAQAFAAQTSEPAWRPTTPSATTREEPPLWLHRPPTCGRCGARMRLPRHPAGDGWTWGAFGWQHACGFHR